MMMTSARPPPAPPPPAAGRLSGAVTVTIAFTSRAPSGRYSFWNTSTVKSDWLMRPISYVGHGKLRRVALSGPGARRKRDEHHRDVVAAARFEREVHQRHRGAEGVADRAGQRQLSEPGRIWLVVPQPIGAEQHGTWPFRSEGTDVGLSFGGVGADPPSDDVSLRRCERLGFGEHSAGDEFLRYRVVHGELPGTGSGGRVHPVRPAVAEPAQGDLRDRYHG